MAPLLPYYDVSVHYGEVVFTIRQLDPDRYSKLDLIDDIWEYALHDIHPSVGVCVKVYYKVGTVRCDIDTDYDLLEMFEIVGKPEVHIFVEVVKLDGPVEATYPGPPPAQLDGSEGQGEGQHQETTFLLLEDASGSVPVPKVSMTEGRPGCSGDPVPEIGSECGDFPDSDSEDESFYDDSATTDSLDSDGVSLYSEHESEERSTGECRAEEIGPEQMAGFTDDDSCNTGVVSDLGGKRKKKPGVVYIEKKGEKITLDKGLMFNNVNHFREVLRDYVIQEGFKLVRDKNERTRVTAHCGSEGCKWRIHASPMADGTIYQIKSIVPSHNCVAKPKNPEATSKWIAKKMIERLRENPGMSLDSMQRELLRKFGVECSRMQVYRARKKAMENAEGNFKDSYRKLPMYAVEIRRTNPGSVVKIQYERLAGQPNPCFLRIFICYEAVMAGLLKGCRLFIGLDGCHLKGPYGGVLLATIALDGDEGIFPVAFGMVEIENKESWSFFMDNLQTCIGSEKAWTFMSDGQKGIEFAIREFFPGASQRRCLRHLYTNFKQLHAGTQLRSLFWAAAKAYNAAEFRKAMEQIRTARPAAHEWMMNNPLELWARHRFDPAVRVDHLTNNFTESFNNWVGELRSKPILTLLDGIRSKMMGRIRDRFQQGSTWEGVVTKTTRMKLEKISQESRNCSVVYAGGDEYEVLDRQIRYVVYLERRTCSCRRWDIAGIPCKHGAACLLSRRMCLENYCDPLFSKVKYLETYERIIHPMLDESMWEGEVLGDPIDPPQLRRLPGRPRKNRRREEDEVAAGTSKQRKWHSISCKNCGQVGHNSRTCQRAPVKKRQGGRQSSSRPNKRNRTSTAAEPTTQCSTAPQTEPTQSSAAPPPEPTTQSSAAPQPERTKSSAAPPSEP